MNRENVLKVADAIEKHSIPDLGFNMAAYLTSNEPDKSGHGCGTVACIAGWAFEVSTNRRPVDWHDDVDGVAAAFFGIDARTAEKLFVPLADVRATFFPLLHAEPRHAVAVLRHLAETGEVDWSVADKVARDDPRL